MRYALMLLVLAGCGCGGGGDGPDADRYIAACITHHTIYDECVPQGPRDYDAICEDDRVEHEDRWPECVGNRAELFGCWADLACGGRFQEEVCRTEQLAWAGCLEQYY